MSDFHLLILLLAFSVALLATLVLTPGVIVFAKRFGFVDRPQGRKVHTRIVPRLGGVAIFAATWLTLLSVIGVEKYFAVIVFSMREQELVTAFVAGFIMLVVGAIDDRIDLPASAKLGVQVIVAVGLVITGHKFSSVGVPQFGTIELTSWMAFIVSVVWIVGVTNAINLIDGIDGLATGVVLFIALTVGIISASQENIDMAVASGALAGACLGFLRYNFNPAKIFLGDSGALGIGMTLAVFSLEAGARAAVAGSFLIPIVLFGYPTLDTILVMVRRKLRGKPLMSGDRGHIHHRLLAAGLGHRQVSLVLYAFTLVFCTLAVGLTLRYHTLTIIGLTSLAMALLLALRSLGYSEFLTRKLLSEDRPKFQLAYHRMQAAKAEMRMATEPSELLLIICRVADQMGASELEIRRIKHGVHSRITLASWKRRIPESEATDLKEPKSRPEFEKFRFRKSWCIVRVTWACGKRDDLMLEHRVLLAKVLREFDVCWHRVFESRESSLTEFETEAMRMRGNQVGVDPIDIDPTADSGILVSPLISLKSGKKDAGVEEPNM